jgi:hypothetical protein
VVRERDSDFFTHDLKAKWVGFPKGEDSEQEEGFEIRITEIHCSDS